MTSLSKVELLALIKIYNKNNDKIKNVDKLKKEELLNVCQKYGLLADKKEEEIVIDLQDVCKKDLVRDVELYFMKQNRAIPNDVIHMRKSELIDYMILHNVKHYTSESLTRELEELQKYNELKNIIAYNIIRYDNVDVNVLGDNSEDLQAYIVSNNLSTNIENLQAYAVLVNNLYTGYEAFCKTIGIKCEYDKIKSLPKIVRILNNICIEN